MTAFLGVLYLLVFLAAGCTCVRFLLPRKSLLTRVWLGVSLGLLLMMWLPALIAFAVDFTWTAHLLALIPLAGLTAGCFFLRDPSPVKKWDAREKQLAGQMLMVVLPLTLLSGYLQYTHCLRVGSDGGWWVGQSTYGDLPMHMSFITSLKNAAFPPDYALFPGQRLSYPFLTDSLSTSLYLMGFSLEWAIVVPGTLMMALCFTGVMVLAREMTLQDIAILRDKTPPELEIEAFVHGAMCMSVSGRCLLSNYMAGRDANRGQCAQPCRWKYYLSEETRPGQLYEIGENENGSYILNANDLCTAPFIDLICKAGVDSLKIEGRAKTFYYVASVTAAYRKALDAYLADPANDNFELPPEVYAELTRTSHRHYSPGFYFGKEKALQTPSHTYVRDWDFIGTVDSWEDGVAHCTQRSKFCLGDSLEILQPDGSVVPVTPEWIKNAEGEAVDATPHPMMQYTIPCATPLMPYSLLRMQKRQ